MAMTVEECRIVLGGSAESMTDDEVEAMRDGLEQTADTLFAQMIEAGSGGLEAARWASYFRETGEGE